MRMMEEEEVQRLRDEQGIKLRGRIRPAFFVAPVRPDKQDPARAQRARLRRPFAIQQQAIPTLMSGRDVIGVAKTGSGKTLSFVLPMLRHVLDQPPLEDGDGPIGLILVPARELAQQIYAECRKFCRRLDLRVACCYGGSPMADNINALKAGAEIVVATPGRFIDILSCNNGTLISLRRVTFSVLDEADRMFDLGFEPQVTKIMQNVRPDRQACLFSATFPRQVESIARRFLCAPVEIMVGGRSVVSDHIDQFVEVREEPDKYARLLQLLGEWYDRGSVLVFVDKRELCDRIFRDLLKSGTAACRCTAGWTRRIATARSPTSSARPSRSSSPPPC